MIDPLLQTLAEIVGPSNLLTGRDAAPYLEDWRGRYHGQARAVVKPGNTDEVAAVVMACRHAGVPMVPQGGNTGLCGGATPLADGRSLALNVSRLNQVREVDAMNGSICVGAGCTLAQVQAAAESVDRLFPLSLASEGSCEIGGNISTNAGGVHVLRYGNTRDLVLGLEVVLPDGRIWNGLTGLRKDNTGYDLKQLFIGAEGTLGVVTAAVLKLFPRPRARAVSWIGVAGPEAALALLARLRTACGDRVVAFELVGRSALELVLRHIPGSIDPLPSHRGWSVLLELADSVADAGLEVLLEAELAYAIERGWAVDAAIAGSLAQLDALWALRENISEAQKIEGFSIKHDISVPVSHIPAFLAEAEQALRSAYPDVRVVAFGHFGDGNLHYNLSKPDAEENDLFQARGEEINRIVHDLLAAHRGSISAEHGIGQLKRAELRRYKDPLELELMARLKQALDPLGLMNPGKVL
jgi:FAD/FMN-containing dehydrogenase